MINKEEIEKDILFQIDMQLYDEFNDKFCEINEHLGDVYTYNDLRDIEEAEKEKERTLLRGAIAKLQNRIKELEEIDTEHQKLNGELQEKYSKLENHYNCRLKDIEMLNAHIEKLNRQNEELQEIIDGKVIQELGTSDMYKED